MIGTIFKYAVIGILALIGIGIAFSLVSFALVLAIKVGIVAAIGYGVYKLVGGGRNKQLKQPEISEADRRWLES